MKYNETLPPKRKTTMTTITQPETTIKVEDLGNGIFIKWKIATT